MSGQIFISYRREDSSAWAGRLSDHLNNHFPSNQIFMDVDSVDPGEDFVKTVEETVGSCDVLIAVIGKGWLTSCDQEGQPRLNNPEDFVRIEIATALKREIRVIPVLVEGASMPQSRDLPEDLQPLVRRNALQLSHDRFRTDSERLESAVERVLEKTSAERREREEQERLEHEPQSPPVAPVAPSTVAGIMTLLALVIGLVVVAAIYFSSHPSKSPTPEVAVQPSAKLTAPVTVVSPSPAPAATPTVEEKARSAFESATPVRPSATPTAPVTVVTPSPAAVATPTVEEKARSALENATPVQPSATPAAPVTVMTPSPAAVAIPTVEEKARSALESATKDHPWVNSLRMKFVPVAGTQVLFSVWDTRVQDFETFVKSTGYDATGGMYSLGKDRWKQRGATWKEPGFSQGPNHPVVGVSWIDAEEFCKWLTKRERSAGDLPQDREYRLPKDEEWSAAVGLKDEVGSTPEEKSGKIKLYPWDIPQKRAKSWPPPAGAGNYAGEEAKNGDWPSGRLVIEGYNDGYPRTSPVGSFEANQFGLYDMGGNVWQWCEDWYNAQAHYRVLRGASCYDHIPGNLLASSRLYLTPDYRIDFIGFRCVAVESSR